MDRVSNSGAPDSSPHLSLVVCLTESAGVVHGVRTRSVMVSIFSFLFGAGRTGDLGVMLSSWVRPSSKSGERRWHAADHCECPESPHRMPRNRKGSDVGNHGELFHSIYPGSGMILITRSWRSWKSGGFT